MDGDLACLGAEDIALYADNVADIELFEVLIRFLAHKVARDICLNIALEVLNVAEGRLAHYALGHEAAGDGDTLALQLVKAVLYVRRVVGRVIFCYKERVLPCRLKLAELVAAYLQDLGKILSLLRAYILAHMLPLYFTYFPRRLSRTPDRLPGR